LESKSIFVSYAEKDSDFATRVGSIIRDAGHLPWLYQQEVMPGEEYIEAVSEALHESDATLVILSKISAESQHVRNEVVQALEDRKPIIPLLKGLTHPQLIQNHVVWRTILGARVTFPIPRGGPEAIKDKIIGAIEGGQTGAAPVQGTSRRPLRYLLLVLAVVIAGVGGMMIFNRGADQPVESEALAFVPVATDEVVSLIEAVGSRLDVGDYEKGEILATEAIIKIRQGLPWEARELAPYRVSLGELFALRARSFGERQPPRFKAAVGDQRRSGSLSPSAEGAYVMALFFHEWGVPDSARHYVDVARARYAEVETPPMLIEYVQQEGN